MSGTLEGGAKAAKANKAKDPDYYRKIGAIGGASGKAQGTIKGFSLDRERARRAGAIGGKISRRSPVASSELYLRRKRNAEALATEQALTTHRKRFQLFRKQTS